MKADPSRFVSANLPVNKFKNRLVNILPCEYMLRLLSEYVGKADGKHL